MSRTREERKRRRAQALVQGGAFFLLLVLCICVPGWVEAVVVDHPAGMYAEVQR